MCTVAQVLLAHSQADKYLKENTTSIITAMHMLILWSTVRVESAGLILTDIISLCIH
jgi:hypothetical protein